MFPHWGSNHNCSGKGAALQTTALLSPVAKNMPESTIKVKIVDSHHIGKQRNLNRFCLPIAFAAHPFASLQSNDQTVDFPQQMFYAPLCLHAC